MLFCIFLLPQPEQLNDALWAIFVSSSLLFFHTDPLSVPPSPFFCLPEPFFCRPKRSEAKGVPWRLCASGRHGWAVAPSASRGVLSPVPLWCHTRVFFFLCCNLYFSAYSYLKKSKSHGAKWGKVKERTARNKSLAFTIGETWWTVWK